MQNGIAMVVVTIPEAPTLMLWCAQDFILGESNLTKFQPVLTYDISKKNVVVQV